MFVNTTFQEKKKIPVRHIIFHLGEGLLQVHIEMRILIFLIYLIHNSKLFSTKLVLKILEVLALFSIILLQSRLGLISVVTIYLLYFILMKPLRKNICISLLISSLFFLYFNTNDFYNKIEKTYSFQNLGDDDSTNQRLSFYQTSISLFNENPLYGNGLGSWKYKSLQNDNTKNKKILVPYYTHNDFLQTLMETGLIGLLIYLIFFLLLIRNILLKLKVKRTLVSIF